MNWYEAISKAADAIEALKNAELNQLLANVRMEGAKLAEENARMREELVTLREAVKLREALEFRNNAYWLREKGVDVGPFCPKCWPADGKAVRMPDWGNEGWMCPVCTHLTRRQGYARFDPVDDSDFPNDPIR